MGSRGITTHIFEFGSKMCMAAKFLDQCILTCKCQSNNYEEWEISVSSFQFTKGQSPLTKKLPATNCFLHLLIEQCWMGVAHTLCMLSLGECFLMFPLSSGEAYVDVSPCYPSLHHEFVNGAE